MPEKSENASNGTTEMQHPEKNHKLSFCDLNWRGVIIHSVIHVGFLSAICLAFTTPVLKSTYVLTLLLVYLGMLGVTAGAHRLWSHRAYKARLPLRIFLMLAVALASQGDIFEWALNHRVHHKYSETNADPHNALRGFFFSHVGWLLCKKHPEVELKLAAVNTDDLRADPVVTIQKRFHNHLFLLVSVILPTAACMLLGESLLTSFLFCCPARLCVTLHLTWLVNSAAHMWGNRPYDKSINPRDNWLVTFLAVGEGFHNYHHTFPGDYSTSEFGNWINFTTLFIRAMARLGQAYDLRTVSPETVSRRKLRTGEHPSAH